MTNFKVGQKVVCVLRTDIPVDGLTNDPEVDDLIVGGVYTISGMCYGEGCVWFELEEMGFDFIYSQNHFRPIAYSSATAEILQKFPLTEEKADVKVKEVPITQDCE